MTDFGQPSSLLIAAGADCAAAVANESGKSPFLLLGDHAGTAIPHPLGDLGVSLEDLSRHIACDIGIEGLGMRLATTLDSVFIHQRYSRLVIDCNRVPGEEDSIVIESDGTRVPGNLDLPEADKAARVAQIYQPYQDRITTEIEARKGRGQQTVLVSLHSFTPVMKGRARPWKYGVLHAGNSAFSFAVLARLKAEFGDAAGDNEPYRMDEIDNTIPLHADAHDLDYLEIEVRQDLITTPAGQDEVAAFLTRLLPAALADVAS